MQMETHGSCCSMHITNLASGMIPWDFIWMRSEILKKLKTWPGLTVRIY